MACWVLHCVTYSVRFLVPTQVQSILKLLEMTVMCVKSPNANLQTRISPLEPCRTLCWPQGQVINNQSNPATGIMELVSTATPICLLWWKGKLRLAVEMDQRVVLLPLKHLLLGPHCEMVLTEDRKHPISPSVWPLGILTWFSWVSSQERSFLSPYWVLISEVK